MGQLTELETVSKQNAIIFNLLTVFFNLRKKLFIGNIYYDHMYVICAAT